MAIATGRSLLDPYAVLKKAGLTLDMHYADFGSGTLGHFVFPAAEMVGPVGRVYAVDILKSALAGVESRMHLENVHNLTPVWGDIERVGGVNIPADSLNLLSLVNIVGLLKKSPTVLDEVKRLLTRDGRLLLVGWRKDGMAVGVPVAKRVDADELIPIVERAGFRLRSRFDAGPSHWGLLFDRIYQSGV